MIKQVKVHKLFAFADAGEGGNPAGVVRHPFLTPQEKQKIASKAGFSETVFIEESSRALVKLEYFTPVRQVADCGHATVAAFQWLRGAGGVTADVTTRETQAGVSDVFFDGDDVFIEQPVPALLGVMDDIIQGIASSLNFLIGDIHDKLPVIISDNGMPFALIPVNSRRILERIRPDKDNISFISNRLKIAGYLVFSLDPVRPGRSATSRMFAPVLGIHEESATGMANGPLAVYLRQYAGLTEPQVHLEQGHFMRPASPSLITVRMEGPGKAVSRIFVGGAARSAEPITVEL